MKTGIIIIDLLKPNIRVMQNKRTYYLSFLDWSGLMNFRLNKTSLLKYNMV